MADLEKWILPFADDDDDDDDKGEEKKPENGEARDGLLQRMLDSRTIIVSKAVSDELAKAVISQLLVLEQIDAEKPVTVIINSPGGSADSGFAIYDAIRFVRCPVRTITMGICASAAVMIHLAAEKHHRFVTPNSRFLLHQPSMRTTGQASDLEIVSKEIERMKKQYNSIVAETTGKSVADIDRAVSRDYWLTAEEGVAFGLAARQVRSRREIE